jgi:hypothetical protein
MPKFDPYAAPPPGLHDSEGPSVVAHIAGLLVSDTWKFKFLLMERAGGPSLPRLKDLTSSERFIISFNFLAFLFWPFFHMSKGMWKKGGAMVGVSLVSLLVLSVLLNGFGLGRIAYLCVLAVGVVFARRANGDYYRKMVLGEPDDWR